MATKAETLLEPYLAGSAERPNGDLDMHCPIHGDARRSATVNFRTKEWYCHACEEGGSLTRLVARHSDWHPVPGDTQQTSGRSASARPLPDSALLDGWQSALLGSAERREWLERKRGLDLDTMQRYGMGWDGRRYVLPVYDEAGVLQNLRLYSPTLEPKIMNWPGHGSPPRLYPFSTLLDDPKTIVICEGELDALIANQSGVPAITTTGGVKATGRWRDSWTSWFEEKVVYLCFDCDADGRQAARKVAEKLAQQVRKLQIIELPYPMGSKKDLTDFFLDGHTRGKLRTLAKTPTKRDKKQLPHKAVAYEALRAGNIINKPVQIEGTLSSINSTQLAFPQTLKGTCNYDWDPKRCDVCPFKEHGGNISKDVGQDYRLHLELMTVGTDESRQNLFRKVLGAPKNCPKVDIESINFSAWDCEIRNGSNLAEEAFPLILKRDEGPPLLNSPYKLEGRLKVSPRGQRAVFMASKSEPAKQDLDSFTPTKDDIERARAWAGELKGDPDEQLEQVAKDLEYHVTRIYGQRLLHMAVDLVYHSVLQFNFNEELVTRGWMELLAVGDTRSGKSTTAQRIQELYGRGFYQSAENATVAGLLFGVEKRASMSRDGAWSGTVGTLPLNHRGLVVLDEAQGLTKDQIGQMSDMRSRGVVHIAKIRHIAVPARVRLIWLANQRGSSYQYGVDALVDQMGQEEDLARVDIPLFISVDIPDDQFKKVRHHYGDLPKGTREVLQWIVLWSWSRTPEQIMWSEAAVRNCHDLSDMLAEQFSSRDLPILPRLEARVRLARMAVALAARLFSSPDGHRLSVKKEHVHGAYELYHRFLSDERLGMVDIRGQEERIDSASDEHGVEFRHYLSECDILIIQMMTHSEIKDFGYGEVAAQHLRKFQQLDAIQFKQNSYVVSDWARNIAKELM